MLYLTTTMKILHQNSHVWLTVQSNTQTNQLRAVSKTANCWSAIIYINNL